MVHWLHYLGTTWFEYLHQIPAFFVCFVLLQLESLLKRNALHCIMWMNISKNGELCLA